MSQIMHDVAIPLEAAQSQEGALLYGGMALALLLQQLLWHAGETRTQRWSQIGYMLLTPLAILSLHGVALPPLNAIHPSVSILSMPLYVMGSALCLNALARHHSPIQAPHQPKAAGLLATLARTQMHLPWLFTLLLPLLWLQQDGWATALAIGVHALVCLLSLARLTQDWAHTSAQAKHLAWGQCCALLTWMCVGMTWAQPEAHTALWIGTLSCSALSLLCVARPIWPVTLHTTTAHADVETLRAQVAAHAQDLEAAQTALRQAQSELEANSHKDALTGLHNQRFLTERMPEIWGAAVRWKHNVAMLMVDIDHLSHINATHGRLAGDAALQAVAQVICRIIRRPNDHAVRVGEEEFLVVLPQTHTAGAAHMAERIRNDVAALSFTQGGKPIPLTVSIGVASATPGPRTAMNLMLQLADRLLYQAKTEGRNRCALQPTALAQLKTPELVSSPQT